MMSPQKYAQYCGVSIGEKCFIADKNHWPQEAYLIKIGNDCAITEGVKFHTHGGGRIIRNIHSDFDYFGKIKIGNHVYIGSRSMIMPGVTIEDNVLIAAGSIVTKSIPSGYVVGGNPAKIIGSIDSFITKNEKFNTRSKFMTKEQKKKLLLSLPDEMFIKKDYLKSLMSTKNLDMVKS